MKILNFKLTFVFVLALQLICCRDMCPSKYTLELPKPPESWVSLLGEPSWLIEWIAPDGQNKRAELTNRSNLEIELPVTWTNPIIALPYWQEHNLSPGIFKPAGALFPFDVENDVIRLSWEAGVDAVFYRELAFANKQDLSKIPANFDWQRFRELFYEKTLNDDVCEDPWLVDWQSAAEKTISANFDRRRLVAEKTESKTIPVPAGQWYGTSPFTKPLSFSDNEAAIFPVRPGFNLWINAKGILRVNGNTWVFAENKR
jgi:hypothetical protein